MDELTDFLWTVRRLRWIEGEKTQEVFELLRDQMEEPGSRCSFLVPVDRNCRTYRPLVTRTALFRDFAELSPSEEFVLDFARNYGWLGIPESVKLRPGTALAIGERTTDGVTWDICHGESLAVWTKAIGEMRQAVDIWDLAHLGDEAALRSIIHWRDHHVAAEFSGQYRLVASQDNSDFGKLQAGDVIGPAKWLVQYLINEKLLECTVFARLLRESGPKDLEFGLHIVPKSLVGALWLQFAQAIAGSKDFRRCEHCKKYFEIERSDKRFCSPTCKANRHLTKRREAARLFKKGNSYEVIAAQMNVPVSRVEQWISASKEGLQGRSLPPLGS